MTASRRLWYVSTSFQHFSCGMLAHSSLAKASSWVRLVSFLAITLVFKSRHKFSIGFRSGLWLGHSRTLTSLSLNQFVTTLAACFRSLSCWYFQLWPSWCFSADSFTLILMKDPDVILLSHDSLDVDEVPCATGRAASPLHYVSTTMLDGGHIVLGLVCFSFLPPDGFSIHKYILF